MRSGAVWSAVPDEHRVEAAHAYARVGDAYYDLGPSVSGSLTWCGGSAYFVRDPQRQFVPVQRRLARSDTLSEYLEHTGSAVFAVPPGLQDGDDYWGRSLLA